MEDVLVAKKSSAEFGDYLNGINIACVAEFNGSNTFKYIEMLVRLHNIYISP